MRDGEVIDPLTPDDELDLIVLALIDLTRMFSMGREATKDLVIWRLNEMWDEHVNTDPHVH